jgi:excisionase family DNA binding protein
MSEAVTEGDFLNVKELASLLRVDTKTVYAAIQDGSIPGVKRLGRTIRIYRPAVMEWAVKEEARKRR